MRSIKRTFWMVMLVGMVVYLSFDSGNGDNLLQSILSLAVLISISISGAAVLLLAALGVFGAKLFGRKDSK